MISLSNKVPISVKKLLTELPLVSIDYTPNKLISLFQLALLHRDDIHINPFLTINLSPRHFTRLEANTIHLAIFKLKARNLVPKKELRAIDNFLEQLFRETQVNINVLSVAFCLLPAVNSKPSEKLPILIELVEAINPDLLSDVKHIIEKNSEVLKSLEWINDFLLTDEEIEDCRAIAPFHFFRCIMHDYATIQQKKAIHRWSRCFVANIPFFQCIEKRLRFEEMCSRMGQLTTPQIAQLLENSKVLIELESFRKCKEIAVDRLISLHPADYSLIRDLSVILSLKPRLNICGTLDCLTHVFHRRRSEVMCVLMKFINRLRDDEVIEFIETVATKPSNNLEEKIDLFFQIKETHQGSIQFSLLAKLPDATQIYKLLKNYVDGSHSSNLILEIMQSLARIPECDRKKMLDVCFTHCLEFKQACFLDKVYTIEENRREQFLKDILPICKEVFHENVKFDLCLSYFAQLWCSDFLEIINLLKKVHRDNYIKVMFTLWNFSFVNPNERLPLLRDTLRLVNDPVQFLPVVQSLSLVKERNDLIVIIENLRGDNVQTLHIANIIKILAPYERRRQELLMRSANRLQKNFPVDLALRNLCTLKDEHILHLLSCLDPLIKQSCPISLKTFQMICKMDAKEYQSAIEHALALHPHFDPAFDEVLEVICTFSTSIRDEVINSLKNYPEELSIGQKLMLLRQLPKIPKDDRSTFISSNLKTQSPNEFEFFYLDNEEKGFKILIGSVLKEKTLIRHVSSLSLEEARLIYTHLFGYLTVAKNPQEIYAAIKFAPERWGWALPRLSTYVKPGEISSHIIAVIKCLLHGREDLVPFLLSLVKKYHFLDFEELIGQLLLVDPGRMPRIIKKLNIFLNLIPEAEVRVEKMLLSQIINLSLSDVQIEKFQRAAIKLKQYDRTCIVELLEQWLNVGDKHKDQFVAFILTFMPTHLSQLENVDRSFPNLSSLIGGEEANVILSLAKSLNPNEENLADLIEALQKIPQTLRFVWIQELREELETCKTTQQMCFVLDFRQKLKSEDSHFHDCIENIEDKLILSEEISLMDPRDRPGLFKIQKYLSQLAERNALEVLSSLPRNSIDSWESLIQMVLHIKCIRNELSAKLIMDKLLLFKPDDRLGAMKFIANTVKPFPATLWTYILEEMEYSSLEKLSLFVQVIYQLAVGCNNIDIEKSIGLYKTLINRSEDQIKELITETAPINSLFFDLRSRLLIINAFALANAEKRKQVASVLFSLLIACQKIETQYVVILIRILSNLHSPEPFIESIHPLLKNLHSSKELADIIVTVNQDLQAKRHSVIKNACLQIKPHHTTAFRLSLINFYRSVNAEQAREAEKRTELIRNECHPIYDINLTIRFNCFPYDEFQHAVVLFKQTKHLHVSETDRLFALLSALCTIPREKRVEIVKLIAPFCHRYNNSPYLSDVIFELGKLSLEQSTQVVAILLNISGNKIFNTTPHLIPAIALWLEKGHNRDLKELSPILKHSNDPKLRGSLFQLFQMGQSAHQDTVLPIYLNFLSKVWNLNANVIQIMGLYPFHEVKPLLTELMDKGIVEGQMLANLLTTLFFVSPQIRLKLLKQAFCLHAAFPAIKLETALNPLLVVPIKEREALINDIITFIPPSLEWDIMTLIDVLLTVPKEERREVLETAGRLSEGATAPSVLLNLIRACTKFTSTERKQGLIKGILPLLQNFNTQTDAWHFLIDVSTFPVHERQQLIEDLSALIDSPKSTDDLRFALQLLYFIPFDHRKKVIQAMNHFPAFTNKEEIIEHVYQKLEIKNQCHHYLSTMIREMFLREDRTRIRTESEFLIIFAHAIGFSEEHPDYRLLEKIYMLTDPQLKADPYTKHKILKELSINEPLYSLPAPIEKINDRYIQFNLTCLQNKIQTRLFTHEDLPQNVTSDGFEKCFHNLANRIANLEPEKRDAVEKYIFESTQGTLGDLYQHFLCTPLMRSLLNPAVITEGQITQPCLYLYWILKSMMDMNDDLKPGLLLTEREEYLIKVSRSVVDCLTGQLDGITIYYLRLPSKYHVSHIHSFQKQEMRVINLLNRAYQHFLEKCFSDMKWWKKFFPERNCAQGSHQNLYLKNRLFRHLGMMHELRFDPHTELLYAPLINQPLNLSMNGFLEICRIEELITFIRSHVSLGFSEQDVKYMDFIYLIEGHLKRGLSIEELQAFFEYNNDMRAVGLTKEGALMILLSAGYIQEAKQSA